MGRMPEVALALTLAACASGVRLPAPNSAQARFLPQQSAVQVMVSDVAPVTGAALLGSGGDHHPAAAISLLSGPHVAYNPPPTLGFGIGGFGFSGCCSGFGSGVGLDVPVGGPTPASVSDQYVSSAVIPVPADYAQRWPSYRVRVQVSNRALLLQAPPPTSG